MGSRRLVLVESLRFESSTEVSCKSTTEFREGKLGSCLVPKRVSALRRKSGQRRADVRHATLA